MKHPALHLRRSILRSELEDGRKDVNMATPLALAELLGLLHNVLECNLGEKTTRGDGKKGIKSAQSHRR